MTWRDLFQRVGSRILEFSDLNHKGIYRGEGLF